MPGGAEDGVTGCPGDFARKWPWIKQAEGEFGFDRIERQELPESANLLYKVLEARNQENSTALATNVDSNAWADYLGDPPLAMAFLDRLVDRAVILKIQAKSYRASRCIQNPR